MKKYRLFLLGLAAASAPLLLGAAPPGPKAKVEAIIETMAENLILPSSASGGLLVVSECKGCPPRSFRTMRSTGYRLNERPVSLAEFRAALVGRPKTNINVVLSPKTGELLFLDAASETGFAPRPAPKRNQ